MARAGLTPGRKRGAAYFPPVDIAARVLGPWTRYSHGFLHLEPRLVVVERPKPGQSNSSTNR